MSTLNAQLCEAGASRTPQIMRELKAPTPHFLNRLRHRATLRVMYLGFAGADLSAFGSTYLEPPAITLSFCSSSIAQSDNGSTCPLPAFACASGIVQVLSVKLNSRHSARRAEAGAWLEREAEVLGAHAEGAESGTHHPNS